MEETGAGSFRGGVIEAGLDAAGLDVVLLRKKRYKLWVFGRIGVFFA